jgi:hypothetical protein
MRPIVISVEHPSLPGGVVEHTFSTSPIQLGRNAKADLRLPFDFVSSWHALIRFDETSAYYFDLGSTNGSEVEGRRIGPGQEVEFDAPVRIRIAELWLTIRRAGAVKLDGPTARMPPPFVPQTDRTYVPTAPPPDLAYAPPIAAPEPPPMMPPADPRVGPPPSGPRSATRVMAPRRVGSGGAGDGLALIRELSQRLLPSVPPPQTAEEARDLLDRVAMLVETCARGVLEMQAGQERMGQELGVQTVSHYTGLRFAATPSAAIEYLLADPGAGEHRRLDELAMAFADSMTHQVAMLDGLVAGARALADSLEPGAIEREAGTGLLGRFRELWAAYNATWRRLADDDRKLVKALFGPAFARVYAEVGGELSAAWRRNEGGDAGHDGEGSKRAP